MLRLTSTSLGCALFSSSRSPGYNKVASGVPVQLLYWLAAQEPQTGDPATQKKEGGLFRSSKVALPSSHSIIHSASSFCDYKWSSSQYCTRSYSNKPSSTESESPPSNDNGLSAAKVFTLANNISFARLLSGPLLAYWILHDEWGLCFAGLAMAGISDWADGFVAKRYNQNSVLGSYLDPLADKALMGCVISALGIHGIVSLPVVGVIISRDVLLIAGGFYHRCVMLNWKWTSLGEFCRVQPSQSGDCAPRLKPTLSSKFNTVLQLALVTSCIGNELGGYPGAQVTEVLMYSTVATTVISGNQYFQLYRSGKWL